MQGYQGPTTHVPATDLALHAGRPLLSVIHLNAPKALSRNCSELPRERAIKEAFAPYATVSYYYSSLNLHAAYYAGSHSRTNHSSCWEHSSTSFAPSVRTIDLVSLCEAPDLRFHSATRELCAEVISENLHYSVSRRLLLYHTVPSNATHGVEALPFMP